MASLKSKILKGIGWRTLVDLSQQILQIVFTAILARLLTQGDFGLVAMALLVTRFVKRCTQFGFGVAIIQSQTVTQGQISFIFYLQIAINLLLSLLVFFTAPLGASFFEEPALTPIIQVIAWTLLISSFSFPNILLGKNLDYKNYSILEVCTMIVANIVGIGFALKGWGVWALVYRLLVQQILYAALIWPIAKWKPCKPEIQGTRPLFKFGLDMLGTNMLYFFSQNLIGIITGKYLGKEILGVFNIAYTLAILPAQKVKTILSTVLTAGFSKLQDNLKAFKQGYAGAFFIISATFFPAMLGLSAVSENLILSIYGEKWSQAGFFLLLLSLVGLLKGCEHLLRAGIITKGFSQLIFRITLFETLITIPLLFIGMRYYSIDGLVIAYLVIAILTFIFCLWQWNRIIEDNLLFWKAVYQFLSISTFMWIMVFGLGHLLTAFPPVQALVLQIICGMLIYAVLAFTFLRSKVMETYAKVFRKQTTPYL